MSELFAYIATRTTTDPYIPRSTADLRILSRDVSDAFISLAGGHRTVGQISLFPVQRSVRDHLLCDGREVSKASFPELYSFLGDTQGTPAIGGNFVLPDFVGAGLTTATVAATETATEGTVTTPLPPTPPPDWYDNYGDADSGGRRRIVP